MDKQLQVQGLRKMIRPVLLDSLAAMSVTCYMFMILCIDSSKSYNDSSFQKHKHVRDSSMSYNDSSFQKNHLYRTKIIMTAEKEPSLWVVVDGWLSFAPHIGM